MCYSAYDPNLQTLIPDVDMTNVDRLLNTSAENLKAEMITIMEGFGLEKSMIDKAHNSKSELLLNWSAAAMQMSSTICNTAYFHYVDWFNYKYNNKHKSATQDTAGTGTEVSAESAQTITLSATQATVHTGTEVSGKSAQIITLSAPLASGSTECDLKKPKVSKDSEETKNATGSLKKKQKKRKMNGKSSAHSASGRLGTQSPHGFSMDLDLPPAWNPGPNSDGDDMVYHDEEVDMENDLPIPNRETLGCGAAGGHSMRYEGAARIHGWGLTFLEWFNDDDWELASFLLSSALSMAAIDHFLGLELIKALPLFFHTAKELWSRAKLLPSGPKWQYHVISTNHPMKLPVHLYCGAYSMNIQQMDDWQSSLDNSKLPEESTLLGVILSSDKTNITNMTGRHIAHPLLISLANIKMAVQNKASSHTFLLTALLPITEFLHPVKSKTTLTQLKSIKSIVDPLNVEAFFTAYPNLFLTPEALHHWHCESYDHDVQWCIKIGISTLKQVTRRAQRDIRCYLVAVIANAAPPGVVIAVCVLMDFRYLSQAVTIDEKQCQKILDTLKTFYDHKHEVIVHGGHWGAKSKNILDNWYIPKLELMQSVVLSIYQEQSQQITRTMIPRYVDIWITSKNSQTHTATAGYRDGSDDGINDDENTDEAGDIQAAISDFWGTGCVVSNFFKKAQLALLSTTAPRPLRTFVIGSTAIHLNFDPSLQCQAIDDVAEKFCLPNLQAALTNYIQWEGQTVQNLHKLTGQHQASPTTNLPFKHLNIWFKNNGPLAGLKIT
ncbi:uncharacterized protein F5147DRAFT_652936 [Suillus discolor]|uniref:DUF6830 domain-containing protein n=1 Tax=Suillus discolor TaxID=1912936 RepID=A0A9P7JTN0_9AGAM|nr:uncharacterized protein F5147DRAFT_652936 [Suillus discolor]KAG2108214.1 hypothetical protein F5147DRAFT_652936 [Suillus discolor]